MASYDRRRDALSGHVVRAKGAEADGGHLRAAGHRPLGDEGGIDRLERHRVRHLGSCSVTSEHPLTDGGRCVVGRTRDRRRRPRPATRQWRADGRERDLGQDPCQLGGVDLALPGPQRVRRSRGDRVSCGLLGSSRSGGERRPGIRRGRSHRSRPGMRPARATARRATPSRPRPGRSSLRCPAIPARSRHHASCSATAARTASASPPATSPVAVLPRRRCPWPARDRRRQPARAAPRPHRPRCVPAALGGERDDPGVAVRVARRAASEPDRIDHRRLGITLELRGDRGLDGRPSRAIERWSRLVELRQRVRRPVQDRKAGARSRRERGPDAW